MIGLILAADYVGSVDPVAAAWRPTLPLLFASVTGLTGIDMDSVGSPTDPAPP
jgi:hypothetical protein